MNRRTAFGCGMLLLCAACQTDTLFHQYLPTGVRGWAQEDTLEFRLPSLTDSISYRLEVGVKHTEDYPYQNVWIGVLRPQGHTDTLQLRLADTSGRWRGTGMSGSSFQCVSESVPFTPAPGDTLLRVVQLMRDRLLPGITDIGLRLSAFPSRVNPQEDKQQDGETPQR